MMNYAYRKHRWNKKKYHTTNCEYYENSYPARSDEERWNKRERENVTKTTWNVTLPNWTHTFNYYGNFFFLFQMNSFFLTLVSIVACFAFAFSFQQCIPKLRKWNFRLLFIRTEKKVASTTKMTFYTNLRCEHGRQKNKENWPPRKYISCRM